MDFITSSHGNGVLSCHVHLSLLVPTGGNENDFLNPAVGIAVRYSVGGSVAKSNITNTTLSFSAPSTKINEPSLCLAQQPAANSSALRALAPGTSFVDIVACSVWLENKMPRLQS